MKTTYRPNDDEAAVAMTVARRRVRFNSNQSALPGEDPLRKDQEARLENDYMSILGEIATSRLLNLCWTGCGIGPLGEFDVGGAVQVRATAEPNYGLLVKATDKDLEPVVLVWVNKQTRLCTLQGWHFSEAVKAKGKPRHEGTDKLCWILPKTELRPMDNLAWILDYERYERSGPVPS